MDAWCHKVIALRVYDFMEEEPLLIYSGKGDIPGNLFT
jgi:hypothetical protein